MRGCLPPPDANRWPNWCGGCEVRFLIRTLPRQHLPLAGHKLFAGPSMALLHSFTTNAQRWLKLIRKDSAAIFRAGERSRSCRARGAASKKINGRR